MKNILNVAEYSLEKIFLKSIICILGIIRKHSDNNTKSEIDCIVNNAIMNEFKITP